MYSQYPPGYATQPPPGYAPQQQFYAAGPQAIQHDPAPEDPRLGGVGIVFVEGVAKDRIAVITLVNGGPADRDGNVQPGDLVSSVDGVSVLGQSLNQVRQRVLGEPGSRCVLSFDRPSMNSSFSVNLVRESKAQQAGRDQTAQGMLKAAEQRLNAEREARKRMEENATRMSNGVLEARAQMQDEIAGLKAQMDREHDARLAAETQLRMLKNDADRSTSGLSSQLEEASQQLRGERDLRMRADEEVRRLLNELERIQKEKEHSTAQTRQQLQLVAEDARSAHTLKTRADTEAEMLRNELMAVNDGRSKAEIRAREAEDALIRERNAREREIAESMQTASRLAQQLTEAERQLRETTEARGNLEERLHRMLNEMDGIRRDAEHTSRTLKGEIEQLKGEASTWANRRSAIEQTVATAQSEIVKERSLHERAEQAAMQLSEQLQREKANRAAAEQKLVNAAEELRQRTAALQLAEQSLRDAVQRMRDMETNRQYLEKEVQAKNHEMSKAAAELQRAAERLRQEQAVREQLEQRNRALLEQEGAAHNRAIEELRQQQQVEIARCVAEGKSKINALQEQLNALNAQLQASQAEIAKKNSVLEQTTETLRGAMDQRRSDQARVSDLERQLQAAEERMNQARRDLGVAPAPHVATSFAAPPPPPPAISSMPPNLLSLPLAVNYNAARTGSAPLQFQNNSQLQQRYPPVSRADYNLM